MKKRMMLYFGSYNPIHKGHIALAEYVVEKGLCDEVALMISPQSPHKMDKAQASEINRFEMAELACQESKYPLQIRPSVVEFLLPKPSYTINTLRYLSENFGDQMELSILLGSDQLSRLNTWKEWERVLEYPMYIYPRRGSDVPKELEDKIILLSDAPLQDFSSTECRQRLERGESTEGMLSEKVRDYIQEKGLWSRAMSIAGLNEQLEREPRNVDLLLQRGKLHYQHKEYKESLRDFATVVEIDAHHKEAHELLAMVEETLKMN